MEREVTIVFTGVVGFSACVLRACDEAALELLRRAGVAIEDEFVAVGGVIVKLLGDCIMAVFADPPRATDAGLAVLEALAEVEVEGHRPRMLVGLLHGCARMVRGDSLGVVFDIAARVADQSKAGVVLVSSRPGSGSRD